MLEFIQEMYEDESKRTGFWKHYFTLFSIVDGLEAKNTFEFGTGQSTRVIVEAVKRHQGKHASCDMRDLKDTGVPMPFYVENGDMWTYIQKNSNLLNKEDFEEMGPFDFVLHDGSHIPGEVQKDLKKIVPFMKQNSILLVHDTANQKYNGMNVAIRNAVDLVQHKIFTLPYSYGLTIVEITGNEKNGTVTPTWKKS